MLSDSTSNNTVSYLDNPPFSQEARDSNFSHTKLDVTSGEGDDVRGIGCARML